MDREPEESLDPAGDDLPPPPHSSDRRDGTGALRVDRVDVALRALYSVVGALIISVLNSLILCIVVFQLVYSLVTERLPSPRVQSFAHGVTAYYYQLLRYLTHNDWLVPFPFSDFPEPGEPSRPPYGPDSAGGGAQQRPV